jgi:formylglycine-generating enzyme required for sulfatase activity
MASIPSGEFMMGSDDEDAAEKPAHQVRVNAFEMDVTEVTVAAYGKCVEAGRCSNPNTDPFCNWGDRDKNDHPINCVDWSQAIAYCAWVGKRLPTEEEWEYAARGTDGRVFPWGNAPAGSQLCWHNWGYYGMGTGGTCAAGSRPEGRSPFGLDDMAGNVWEWTGSGYSEDYSKGRTNERRVVRGGCWSERLGPNVRATVRGKVGPSTRVPELGFRCARTPG